MPILNVSSPMPSCTPAEVPAKMQAPNTLFIDVRTSDEYASGHAVGAQNIPLDVLSDNIEMLQKYDSVYLICQSGGRSARATELCIAGGVNAINVNGGTSAWRAAGLEIV